MTRVAGAVLRVTAPTAWLFEEPDADRRVSSQLLFGQTVYVDEERGDWLRITSARDDYSGWMQRADAAASDVQPTGPSLSVCVPTALTYRTPDFHYAPVAALPMHAQVMPVDEDNSEAETAFVRLISGDYIPRQHIKLGAFTKDPVAIARLFLGAPYAWGGRTVNGIDCSGLVQMSLWACAMDCPRDSVPQFDQLGAHLSAEDTPQEGDLVFFPGHVGFYLSGDRLLHANATHMCCTIDPLEEVIGWVAKEHSAPLRGFKRITL